MSQSSQNNWMAVCDVDDLAPNAGVCALVADQQVALFYFPDNNEIYAIDNYDPFGQANVLFRGITGDIQGQSVVASPLYKQHFILATGQCVEDDRVNIASYAVRIVNHKVEVALKPN
ncbi:MAG: nitrite reductase small subunit NirD [Gammaproteobacteria bacterium]|nr:nitrite reductase small subunit NirD [Gammaproteobacteria bacterium]